MRGKVSAQPKVAHRRRGAVALTHGAPGAREGKPRVLVHARPGTSCAKMPIPVPCEGRPLLGLGRKMIHAYLAIPFNSTSAPGRQLRRGCLPGCVRSTCSGYQSGVIHVLETAKSPSEAACANLISPKVGLHRVNDDGLLLWGLRQHPAHTVPGPAALERPA